jgi:GrpB-like predicted nucleotidyltransferase (UPF0157 family)
MLAPSTRARSFARRFHGFPRQAHRRAGRYVRHVSEPATYPGPIVTQGADDGPIQIVEHDPRWAAAYLRERERLTRLLPGVVIHHIGSTAVPGVAAKPVIDMIALVPDLESAVDTAKRAGYVLPAKFNAGLEHRRYLCYPSASHRTHHLHLVDREEELQPCLRFRDTLVGDPRVASEYVALKRELAARFGRDRLGYTAAKTEFIGRCTCAPDLPGPGVRRPAADASPGQARTA